MVSLKWGDVLSTLLPGAVALYAANPYFPALREKIEKLDQISLGSGVTLLMAAALAGGVLEAITRILWERYWLVWRCKPYDALSRLTPENMELYERGVQSSYKYVTFYANFAWAILLLAISRVWSGAPIQSIPTAILAVVFLVLLRASHVQWTYYVNYQMKLFGEGSHDAGKRSASGNHSQIHDDSQVGTENARGRTTSRDSFAHRKNIPLTDLTT